MEYIGKVTKVNQDKTYVTVPKNKTCGSSCEGCHGCTVPDPEYCVKNSVGASEGDEVILFIPDKTPLPIALYFFTLPIAVPLLLYYLFHGVSQTLGIISAVCGLVLWALGLVFINKRIKKDERYFGKILSVISENGEK